MPWPALPRGEALWARRVFNAADVAKEGLLDHEALSLVLAAANTAPIAQHSLPQVLAALPRSNGALSNCGVRLAQFYVAEPIQPDASASASGDLRGPANRQADCISICVQAS